MATDLGSSRFRPATRGRSCVPWSVRWNVPGRSCQHQGRRRSRGWHPCRAKLSHRQVWAILDLVSPVVLVKNNGMVEAGVVGRDLSPWKSQIVSSQVRGCCIRVGGDATQALISRRAGLTSSGPAPPRGGPETRRLRFRTLRCRRPGVDRLAGLFAGSRATLVHARPWRDLALDALARDRRGGEVEDELHPRGSVPRGSRRFPRRHRGCRRPGLPVAVALRGTRRRCRAHRGSDRLEDGFRSWASPTPWPRSWRSAPGADGSSKPATCAIDQVERGGADEWPRPSTNTRMSRGEA